MRLHAPTCRERCARDDGRRVFAWLFASELVGGLIVRVRETPPMAGARKDPQGGMPSCGRTRAARWQACCTRAYEVLLVAV